MDWDHDTAATAAWFTVAGFSLRTTGSELGTETPVRAVTPELLLGVMAIGKAVTVASQTQEWSGWVGLTR